VSDKLPPKLLVAEHDEVLNANLCNAIERYWFDVIRVHNCQQVLRLIDIDPPHLYIISSRVKDMSALELGSQITKHKSSPNAPIIFIIDAEEKEENYRVIKNSTVEILRRPYDARELMTLIRALLRRSKPQLHDRVIKHGDIAMDLSTFKVTKGGQVIHLGPTEFKILRLFIKNPKKIYSRRQIIDYVWGIDKEIAHRTIDVHINRIRTLMKIDRKNDPFITTIRSSGYILN